MLNESLTTTAFVHWYENKIPFVFINCKNNYCSELFSVAFESKYSIKLDILASDYFCELVLKDETYKIYLKDSNETVLDIYETNLDQIALENIISVCILVCSPIPIPQSLVSDTILENEEIFAQWC